MLQPQTTSKEETKGIPLMHTTESRPFLFVRGVKQAFHKPLQPLYVHDADCYLPEKSIIC